MKRVNKRPTTQATIRTSRYPEKKISINSDLDVYLPILKNKLNKKEESPTMKFRPETKQRNIRY